MGGSLQLSDKIFFWVVTLFFGMCGLVMLFSSFPWGIFLAMIVFYVWALIVRGYTWAVIEDRGVVIESTASQEEDHEEEVRFDDPRWFDDPNVPEEAPTSRILSAGREIQSGSRILGSTSTEGIIMGPTPAGGLITEPGKKRDSNRDDDREFADMMRSL